MEVCGKTSSCLIPFFDGVYQSDWSMAETHRQDIVSLERQADELKRKLRLSLPGTLFLPVPRIHLLEILQLQDRIPNTAKDIAGLMVARQLAIPADLVETFDVFLKSSVETSNMATTVLNRLEELLQSGFSGREVDVIEEELGKLSESEHRSDEFKSEVQRKLLSLEHDQNPVDVMFLYRVIDWVGQLADDSQAVGNRMLYLIAR